MERQTTNSMQADIKNTNTVVTGGNRGIGKKIALNLAQNGRPVIVLDKEVDENTREELNQISDDNTAIGCDVSDYNAVQDAEQHIQENLGPVTHLVNNAGIVRVSNFLDQDPEEWENLFSVNAVGVMNCCHVFGDTIIEHDGAIVNVASTDALVGRRGHDTELGVDAVAAYSASKGAVATFTKSLAVEWGSYGVRVNAVAPILVETPRTQHLFEDDNLGADYDKRLPLGETPRTDEVADTVSYLLSENASKVTGQILNVDAGYMAGGEL